MKTKLIFLAVVSTLLGLSPGAHAATRTWNGGGADNLWTNAANWGGTAPVAGDNLVFPGTAPADSLVNTNNFPANTTFGSITLTGTNYNLPELHMWIQMEPQENELRNRLLTKLNAKPNKDNYLDFSEKITGTDYDGDAEKIRRWFEDTLTAIDVIRGTQG